VDPLLLTFQVGPEPLLFDISSNLSPVSIRDQMFRGAMIVRRAIAQGFLSKDQSLPLLIVGGGVAGAMAAMVAAENAIPTVLAEAEKPMIKQDKCRRIVCPTQYDWPAPHWKKGKYPWNDEHLPLEWNSDKASAVSSVWHSKLNEMTEKNPGIFRIIASRFKGHSIQRDNKAVEAIFDNRPPIICAVIISCAGFGIERTWIPKTKPSYKGFDFWDLDEFESTGMGLSVPPKVLISGGGDGALQDFLRITTGQTTARSIYSCIPAELKPDIENQILIAEDYALRSNIWGSVGELDCPVQFRLHEGHQKIVSSLLADERKWDLIEKALGKLILARDKQLSIKLAYPCNHFSTSYALNRFLTLLIVQYMRKRQPPDDPLSPLTKVMLVSGSNGHKCKPLADNFDEMDKDATLIRRLINAEATKDCYGKNHSVAVVNAKCSTFDVAGANENEWALLEGDPYNVVVIRHGVKPPKPLFKRSSAASPARQLIPYYIPW